MRIDIPTSEFSLIEGDVTLRFALRKSSLFADSLTIANDEWILELDKEQAVLFSTMLNELVGTMQP